MTATTQSYANHRRYFSLYHSVALPIFMVNVFGALRAAARRPSLLWAWSCIVAMAFVVGLVASRTSTLIVQNRVIGLEMRLRLATILPVELCQRIPELHLKQLVGL